MEMSSDALLGQVDALIEAGDERALKDFLIEHYKELPENVRNEFLFATFAEALEKRVSDLETADLQQNVVAMMEALGDSKEGLGDK